MALNDRKLRQLPVRSLAPNILTVLGLCAGLTALRFALQGQFEKAIIAVIVAAVIDALDGRVARFLKGATKFGAELDSLVDFVNFGVVPVLVLYLWNLQDLGGLGWIAVLGFAVCCALRLARFNTALDTPDKPVWGSKFFVGVPAPSGAGLAVLPVILSFLGWDWVADAPFLVALYTGGIAALMVSHIPTFSFKGMSVRRDMVMPILLIVGLGAAVLLSYPWGFLTVLGIGYFALIPFSILRYRRYASGGELLAAQEVDQDDAPVP